MDTLATYTGVNRDLLAALGEQVTVARGDTTADVVMFIDDSVQDVGQYARVVGGKRVVSCMRADWLLARGDLVTARGTSRKVDEILADDGIVVTAVLHG